MQELVLIQLSRTVEGELQRGAAEAALRSEFEERLAECGALAFRVALVVVRNTGDAEDVSQEAAMRAYRQFKSLRDRSSFRAWLVRITFRLALDHCKSGKRREKRETFWARPERTPIPPNAEDLAVANQFQSRLDRALDDLPEKHRFVLLLSAIEGHSIEEVAGLLRIPIGTVKSRLFFARKLLAEKLR
jgi:RNA polymerase sigma-70 factor (ECF subfamily)